MRWPAKPTEKDGLYEFPVGSVRTVKHFAWLPVRCLCKRLSDDMCWVWLGSFYEVQKLTNFCTHRWWKTVRREVFDR